MLELSVSFVLLNRCFILIAKERSDALNLNFLIFQVELFHLKIEISCYANVILYCITLFLRHKPSFTFNAIFQSFYDITIFLITLNAVFANHTLIFFVNIEYTSNFIQTNLLKRNHVLFHDIGALLKHCTVRNSNLI